MQKEEKKTDTKAVKKVERRERIYGLMSIGAIFAVKYSTNRTVKIYSDTVGKNLAVK